MDVGSKESSLNSFMDIFLVSCLFNLRFSGLILSRILLDLKVLCIRKCL